MVLNVFFYVCIFFSWFSIVGCLYLGLVDYNLIFFPFCLSHSLVSLLQSLFSPPLTSLLLASSLSPPSILFLLSV